MGKAPWPAYITITYTTWVTLTGDKYFALLRPPAQSSTIPGYEASYAVDGDPDTFSVAAAGGDLNPWAPLY